MTEQKARVATGIEITYERFGDPAAPPILLVMGIAAQMIHWHDGFCSALVAHGFHVVRFDNRDSGLSTHLPALGVPDFAAALTGDTSSAKYTLSDMATDTAGLITALGYDSVHLVGASMGGMIAQTVAVEHPARVRSLVSMMSTTGNPAVGQASPEGRAALAGAAIVTRQDAIDRAVASFRLVGSPGYPVDEAAIAERAGRAYDRSFDLDGTKRQAVAVIAAGDRTSRLAAVRAPTLVIHGADDKMCDVSGGRATAAAIAEAELAIIPGMGHNVPPGLWPELSQRIADHAHRAESARS
jgi:pimeloyl-ACP methyl ester carboxylesterase